MKDWRAREADRVAKELAFELMKPDGNTARAQELLKRYQELTAPPPGLRAAARARRLRRAS